MYKAIFNIDKDCIDETNQELFTPFIRCFQIHSVTIFINGVAYDNGYNIVDYKTKWISSDFKIESDDSIIFDINYFYIRPDDIEVLGFLIDSTTYSNSIKSKEIVSKHYIEGQFSLDNGLYKNAVLNFGTTIEGILNKNLSRQDLKDLINNYSGGADKADMHSIRLLRNKVHPNQISTTQDITRSEAIEARNKLEVILRKI